MSAANERTSLLKSSGASSSGSGGITPSQLPDAIEEAELASHQVDEPQSRMPHQSLQHRRASQDYRLKVDIQQAQQQHQQQKINLLAYQQQSSDQGTGEPEPSDDDSPTSSAYHAMKDSHQPHAFSHQTSQHQQQQQYDNYGTQQQQQHSERYSALPPQQIQIHLIGEPATQQSTTAQLAKTDITGTSTSPPILRTAPSQQGQHRVLYSVDELMELNLDGTYATAANPLWLSVEDCSDQQLELIGKRFGLHPLTVEDCQSQSTREKLEIFHHYLFLVFHALDTNGAAHQQAIIDWQETHYSSTGERAVPHQHLEMSSVDDSLRTTPIKLIVFPHLVLSFHRSRNAVIRAVRQRLRRTGGNRVASCSWLVHAMLDTITDSLLPVVDGTSAEVDALEDLIYVLSGAEHRDLLKRMGLTRRRLHALRQRLWAKRDILMSLIGKDWQHFLSGVQLPYLRDVYDHVVTMLHKVESASDLLAALQNTYLANVSIDVSEASNDANAVMKNLSAVATIILPLSLVAGLMGMNW